MLGTAAKVTIESLQILYVPEVIKIDTFAVVHQGPVITPPGVTQLDVVPDNAKLVSVP